MTRASSFLSKTLPSTSRTLWSCESSSPMETRPMICVTSITNAIVDKASLTSTTELQLVWLWHEKCVTSKAPVDFETCRSHSSFNTTGTVSLHPVSLLFVFPFFFLLHDHYHFSPFIEVIQE
eukprot:m.31568 g.31568  ORF g.31568 m.31568 type:complete len:122 (-) comp5375_c0_seq1:27-392(-)